MEIQIEKMKLEDIVECFAIEQQVFTSRWTPETFSEELSSKNGYYLKAVAENKIVGYTGTQMVLDEAHITTLAVHSDFQGKGAGKALVERLLHDLKLKEVKHFSLEVRESNLRAQHIYARFGFQAIAKRKDYYAHPREDALLMVLDV